jgi:hypothetical protein
MTAENVSRGVQFSGNSAKTIPAVYDLERSMNITSLAKACNDIPHLELAAFRRGNPALACSPSKLQRLVCCVASLPTMAPPQHRDRHSTISQSF